MANKTITELTAASTPLSGAEVLPIVQSGTTVKVSAANLTDGRAVECLSLTAGGLVESTLGGFKFPDGTTQTTAATGSGTVTSVGGTGTVNGITLTGTVTTSGNLTLAGTLSGIANSALVNSSITINGTATALGGSISVGTVTSIGGTGTVNGLTLTGTVTGSGNLTLGGTLTGVSLTSAVTGTLPVANGGTGQTTASAAFNALSPITTTGDLILGNGTNSATRLPIGANTYVLTSNGTTASWQPAGGGGGTGTVTSVSGTGTVNGLTLTGTVTTSGSLTLGGTLSGIDNAALTNSTITINGTATALGASISVGTVTSVAALTLGTTGTDLSSTVATGTTTPVITLNVPTASATNRGALSSADWSTFNGKQAALVSGSNIKTVNGTSLLGSGDVGTISVAYGGTGATSLTGVVIGNGTSAFTTVTAPSGTIVGTTDTQNLTNKTLTTGNTLDAGTSVSDTGTIAATSPGFRGLPQNSQTASYTLALADAGKHISITTGGVVIPANGSVAFPVGTAIAIYNNSGSNQTISITTDTLRQAGTANTGSRTLAQYGLCTVTKVASTTWVISGAGVS